MTVNGFLFFFTAIGVPIFLSHQLKDPRPYFQRKKEDNYWNYYLQRKLIALNEEEGVQPLLTMKEELAEEMCKEFYAHGECEEHFKKYYELYMLEYFNHHAQKYGNDLYELKQDLTTGRQRVLPVEEQRRLFANRV